MLTRMDHVPERGWMRARHRIASQLAQRDDDGNLVLTLILLLAISILITASVTSVIGGIPTSTQAQYGAEAVAQAHAGLSDALFRLDQAGDNIASFCVGDPPSSLMSSGVTTCAPAGTSPLASAPGLQYYVVGSIPGPYQSGVTNEFELTSHASWKGQTRTITGVLYREADQFGFFGVNGFTGNGVIKAANVEAVGASGNPLQGNVDFGLGAGATATCNGDNSNANVTTIGESGAHIGASCPNQLTETTSLEPANPTVCAPNQASTAFAPCINTSAFATSSGSVYCPLPGTNIPNTLPTGATATLATPPPATGAVFDCATGGGTTVTIDTTAALPFGGTLRSIPPGSYYFDSNNVVLNETDPSLLANTVNLFILPAACGAGGSGASCPVLTPAQGGSCTGTYSPTLRIAANQNVASGSTPPPGEPSNWNLFWQGSSLSAADKIWFDGALYAPNGDLTYTGANGMKVFGSLILGCWTVNGTPAALTFAYSSHAKNYLVNWSVAHYRITY